MSTNDFIRFCISCGLQIDIPSGKDLIDEIYLKIHKDDTLTICIRYADCVTFPDDLIDGQVFRALESQRNQLNMTMSPPVFIRVKQDVTIMIPIYKGLGYTVDFMSCMLLEHTDTIRLLIPRIKPKAKYNMFFCKCDSVAFLCTCGEKLDTRHYHAYIYGDESTDYVRSFIKKHIRTSKKARIATINTMVDKTIRPYKDTDLIRL